MGVKRGRFWVVRILQNDALLGIGEIKSLSIGAPPQPIGRGYAFEDEGGLSALVQPPKSAEAKAATEPPFSRGATTRSGSATAKLSVTFESSEVWRTSPATMSTQ